MLFSFRVSNFRSIRDEQEFSFLHGSSAGQPEATDASTWNANVGTVAGLFGANASGKSNLLRAAQFMRDAVNQSYSAWRPDGRMPFMPFILDTQHHTEPSLFEVNFSWLGMRYQYGFRLTSERIVGEWLYAYPTHRRQVWFERDISSDPVYYFGKSFTGRNRVIADLTRPNSLFLSTAANNNHKAASTVAHWFRAHLRITSPLNRGTRETYTRGYATDPERWEEVADLMKYADLGICSTRVRYDKDPSKESVFRALQSASPSDTNEEAIERAYEQSRAIVEFGHSTDGGANPVYLPIGEESLGTRTWFALAGPIIHAIRYGDTLLVDELDSSLHPQLTARVLSIFRDRARNPGQAQLLFTTHDTTLLGTLMGQRELHRDQVWFTEKSPRDGATTLYPLTDFSPRKSENIERGYLQGRYGAIPYFDEKLLAQFPGDTEPSHEDEFVTDGDES